MKSAKNSAFFYIHIDIFMKKFFGHRAAKSSSNPCLVPNTERGLGGGGIVREPKKRGIVCGASLGRAEAGQGNILGALALVS